MFAEKHDYKEVDKQKSTFVRSISLKNRTFSIIFYYNPSIDDIYMMYGSKYLDFTVLSLTPVQNNAIILLHFCVSG